MSSFAAALLAVPGAHASVVPATPVAHATSGDVRYAWSQPGGYAVSENVGTAELEIDRSASQAGAAGRVCYGVTNASAEAGTNFIKLAGSGEHQVDFAAGQTQAWASFPVVDQGINGPSRDARAFMYACTGGVTVAQGQCQCHAAAERPAAGARSGEPARLLADADERRSTAVRQVVRVR